MFGSETANTDTVSWGKPEGTVGTAEIARSMDVGVVGMMHGGTSTWMTVWGWVGLAVLVLAVVATVWLVVNLRGRGPDDVRHELDLRYARGEMSSDEYRERRQHLGV